MVPTPFPPRRSADLRRHAEDRLPEAGRGQPDDRQGHGRGASVRGRRARSGRVRVRRGDDDRQRRRERRRRRGRHDRRGRAWRSEEHTSELQSLRHLVWSPPRSLHDALPTYGGMPKIDFLKLAAASRMIDKGTDVGLLFVGAAPDLGAYEYGAATTTGSGGASGGGGAGGTTGAGGRGDRKSTRLNSSHLGISYGPHPVPSTTLCRPTAACRRSTS